LNSYSFESYLLKSRRYWHHISGRIYKPFL